ncbi:nuclear RNA export factor 1-like [Athalia rosae]|uniref:nuclear RNA export factor 1-like n=1 Tax=Athalia rosae TaxID=37344 RepID=UPI0020342FCC|nr:nuclear RNA export factor 1-like [Athalia rosae]
MPRKSNRPPQNERGPPNGPIMNAKHPEDDEHKRFRNFLRPVRNDRRVWFKSQGRPGPDRTRNFEAGLQNYLDEDISMTVGANNGNRQVMLRGNMGRRMPWGRISPFPQRGRRDGRAVPHTRPPMFADSNWFKVVIPYGCKYEKDFIIGNLISYISPDTFVPIMYKVVGNEAVFYVDDPKIADKLYNCDRKITNNEGFKIQVRVKPGFPYIEVDEALKAQMKLAMAKRYNPKTNALDLSKFHQDPALVTDYFCALFRPPVLLAVIDIVAEHLPNLEALNLEGNKFGVIDRLKDLPKKLPKLKTLYIGENRIRELSQLDVLKDLKLEVIRLTGNPVCLKFKERQSEYFSEMRKKFPQLLRLDDIELPAPISFDVADSGSRLPPSQRTFIVNAEAQKIAGQFLQLYFAIFDSDNRQPLLDAYHEHACFSITVAYAQGANRLDGFLRDNRNLFRVVDSDRRRKLLKQGRLPVVSYISELPKTRHDLNGFAMDLCLVTESMMLITVSGIFKELDEKKNPNRYFNRTFVIIPEGSGYCIRNEQLHISHPTEAQQRVAFSEPAVSQMSQPSTSTSTAGSSTSGDVNDETKREMTIALSQQTNMNLEWSLKCLEDVSWNFDNALKAFQEFFKLGQIPAEAFVK